MEKKPALVMSTRENIVFSKLAQVWENGQSGRTGQTVVQHVTWDSRQGYDFAMAQTASLLEMKQSTTLTLQTKLTKGYVILDHVLSQDCRTSGLLGLSVLHVVGLESSID